MVEQLFSTDRAVECDKTVSKGEGDEETSVSEIEIMMAVNALHVLLPPPPFQSSSCHSQDIFFPRCSSFIIAVFVAVIVMPIVTNLVDQCQGRV